MKIHSDTSLDSSEEYYTLNVWNSDEVLDSRSPTVHPDSALNGIEVEDVEIRSRLEIFHQKLLQVQEIFGGHVPFGLMQRYGSQLIAVFLKGEKHLQERMIDAIDADIVLNDWRQQNDVLLQKSA
jgi:hypothetical protein